jgi:hypothetical protein
MCLMNSIGNLLYTFHIVFIQDSYSYNLKSLFYVKKDSSLYLVFVPAPNAALRQFLHSLKIDSFFVFEIIGNTDIYP